MGPHNPPFFFFFPLGLFPPGFKYKSSGKVILPMNLYLVIRRDDPDGWDYYDSFVVACENEEEARRRR